MARAVRPNGMVLHGDRGCDFTILSRGCSSSGCRAWRAAAAGRAWNLQNTTPSGTLSVLPAPVLPPRLVTNSEVTAHLHERGQVDVGFFGGSMRCRRRTIKTQIIDLSVVIASELFLT